MHKSNNMIAILATVLANGLRDQGSIPGQIIQKMKNASLCLLATQYYKVCIKGKWSNQEKDVDLGEKAIEKENLQVTLDFVRSTTTYFYKLCSRLSFLDIWNRHLLPLLSHPL